eukprot:14982.XXX_284793_285107_1 [CDS] Oithona nana genome sequencing.
MLICLRMTASCKGVYPLSSWQLIWLLPPFINSNFASSVCPVLAAACKALCPLWARIVTSAPLSIKNFTVLICFHFVAMNKSVCPCSSARLASEPLSTKSFIIGM